MQQPLLNVISSQRDMIDTFAGYNHNTRIAENEFYDMKNLTSSLYPVLSPRVKRGEYQMSTLVGAAHNPTALISKDALCYVDGSRFYINNNSIDLNLSTDPEDCPKELVSMGAYVIIMPDKKYINTADLSDYGAIENKYHSSATVTYSMCKADGSLYENYTINSSEPDNAESGDLWLDTSTVPNTLKQFSASSGLWVQIATTYVKIACSGIGAAFEKYDGVRISGIDEEIEELKDLNDNTSVLYDIFHDEENPANDYITVIGLLSQQVTQSTGLRVERLMPKLDFLIECNNRLWGCRYGFDINGNVVNEIYSSKQGDFKNWNCFMGLSTDSYTASCGTDGQWTGAVNHLGYPIFFKENFMHKVYGNYPANFTIQSTACRGVAKGCGNSLAIVNEKLLYKSNSGVCAYDGSLPTEISRVFGDVHYSGTDENMTDEWNLYRNGAVAGAFNNKYYISMKSEQDGQWYLFVYDSSSGMWHKEDNIRADAFCYCRNELYFIDHDTKTIKTVNGSGIVDETPVEWYAQTGILGASIPDKKYISRLLVRLHLQLGSRVNIFIQYDSNGAWEQVYSAVGTNIRSFSVPIKPKRCDHFKLRIEGTGECKIFSIVKTIEQGSDY